jgi:hypothetical protein
MYALHALMHCTDTQGYRGAHIYSNTYVLDSDDSCFLGHSPITNSMQQSTCACKEADAMLSQHLHAA